LIIMWKKTVFLLLLLVFLFPLQAAGAGKGQPKLKTSGYKAVAFKGEVLSREIARTTGIALNPILCMSALGAYTYYTTDKESQDLLPWHASPKFWGPLAFVMLLILLKDSSKVALPKVLTVPLDAVETLLEKKASALLALPMLFSAINSGEFEQMNELSKQVANFVLPAAIAGSSMDIVVNSSPDLFATITTFIIVFTIFVVVWVLSHAFNVLILLCPFSTFDMVLATTRNALVAAVIGLSETTFGFGLSLAIIFVAVFFFPRALRLVVFGTVMSFDIIVYRILKKTTEPLSSLQRGIRGFTSCYLSSIPPRTYSTISQKNGEIFISYRPHFFGSQQKVKTTIEVASCELSDGFLSPVVIAKNAYGNKEIQFFRLRAQYHQSLDQVADFLKISVARETSLAGKLAECLKWCGSLFKKTPRLDVPFQS